MPFLKILVVEDYELFRRFICLSLQQRPEFQVIQASNGLEAVQKAKELQPDLILMDIGLPKLNGIEAAKRIRRLAPRAKLIFVSQESDSEVVQETFRLGARATFIRHLPVISSPRSKRFFRASDSLAAG
jgi:DNA-binding NarL/FixJ family response regulator